MRIWILSVLLLVLSGCIPFTDGDGNRLSISSRESSLAFDRHTSVVKISTQLLRAQVKGSIYETGESVSVFGTCLNSTDGSLVQGTYATLSSWYPNGTQYIANVSMQEIQSGYYLYLGSMSVVQGTYLTELICHVNTTSDIAKAWGEWQNPAWVKRIADLNDTISGMNTTIGNLSLNVSIDLTNLSNQISNISMQIGNLSVNISNSFNQTWYNQNQTNVLINATLVNITQQLVVVSNIANSSVDRNDSYLAYLLSLIINNTGIPVTRNLTVFEEADLPILNKDWEIRVEVINEYNISVGYPLVSCLINTTNLPSTVNQRMEFKQAVKYINGKVVPSFTWEEKVRLRDQFNWTVWCFYN